MNRKHLSALVARHAARIMGIRSAFISPNSLAFVMCGPLRPGIARQVAEATFGIQEQVDPSVRLFFVDGSYSPDEPIGWERVFGDPDEQP